MTSLLSVRHLTTTFESPEGVVHAVDDVSFDVQPGETLGLVGESGCGKSVTALSLLRLVPQPPGLIDPASRIVFDGTDILDLGPNALQHLRGNDIAMIFQEPTTTLNPVLTVGAQIAEAIRAHEPASRAEAHRRTVELLDMVGIAEPAQRTHAYPHQLSGGMQQRVMIAMALSCRPRLLVADEPTTALDVTIQAQILDLLRELRHRFAMAMVFITHDFGIVAGIADRIAVMYGGRIVETGPTQALFDHPRHPYTQGLLQAVPRVDRPTERLAGIPGTVPSAAHWPAGCRFHPRCPSRLERCASQSPPDVDVGGDHRAACWLVDSDEPT